MLIKVLHFWFWVCFFFTVQSSDVTDRKHTTSWIRNHKPLQIYANLHLLWYFYYTFSNTIVALILMILQLHIFYWRFFDIAMTYFPVLLLHYFYYDCYRWYTFLDINVTISLIHLFHSTTVIYSQFNCYLLSCHWEIPPTDRPTGDQLPSTSCLSRPDGSSASSQIKSLL